MARVNAVNRSGKLNTTIKPTTGRVRSTLSRIRSGISNTRANIAQRRLLKEQRMSNWAKTDPRTYGDYMTKRANRGTILAGLAGSAGNLLVARLPELMDRWKQSGLSDEQIKNNIKNLKDNIVANKGGIQVRDNINPGVGGRSKAPTGGSTSNKGLFGF